MTSDTRNPLSGVLVGWSTRRQDVSDEHSCCWGPRGAPASRSPPVGAERAGDVILSESVDVPAGSEPVQVRRREFAPATAAMAAITAATGARGATAAENTSST